MSCWETSSCLWRGGHAPSAPRPCAAWDALLRSEAGSDLPQLWPLWGAPCCDFTRRPQSPTAPALLEARRLRFAPDPGFFATCALWCPLQGQWRASFSLPRSDSTWPSWVDLDFIPGFCTAMASFLRMGLWGVMLSSETPRTHGCRSSGCGRSQDKNRSTNHAELLSGSEAVLLAFRPLWLSSLWHGRVCSVTVRISWQGLGPGPSQASPGTVALPPCSPLTSRLQTGPRQVRPGLLTHLFAASLLATSDLHWEALNHAVFRPKMPPCPRRSVLVFAETLNVDRQSSEPGPRAFSKGCLQTWSDWGWSGGGRAGEAGQPKQSSPSPVAL